MGTRSEPTRQRSTLIGAGGEDGSGEDGGGDSGDDSKDEKAAPVYILKISKWNRKNYPLFQKFIPK